MDKDPREIAKEVADARVREFSLSVLGWDETAPRPGVSPPYVNLDWVEDQRRAEKERAVAWQGRRGTIITFLVGGIASPFIAWIAQWLLKKIGAT